MLMKTARRILAATLLACVACAVPAHGSVIDYVKIPDKEFRWELKQKNETAEGTVYELEMVSQVWQGITWKHQLQVFLPKDMKPGANMFLYNQGGKANVASTAFGMDMAKKMGTPVAILYGIPNQPLLDGKVEDALIAETFVRYLNTKDPSWPLLFPMTKSLVRAMDALQEFARKEWKVEIRHFIVSGGSKRGWTTWLTGASDARVKAIAPMVIDTLNMKEQMDHQLRSYGKYSDMIRDYTARGLVPMPNTEDAQKLWKMVDPYFYRDTLKMPKLIVNGANDPYWTVDALNLYWDGLADPKWVLYVPNAGHNLVQKVAGKTDRSRVDNTLAIFSKNQAFDKAMPKLTWKHDDNGGKLRLTINSDTKPVAGRVWIALAPTKDFRSKTWVDQPMTVRGDTAFADVTQPADGCLAFFGELEFVQDGLSYYLSTQMRVVDKNVK
ncbi:MAG TPA: PhoPQ-activated protein PqaA family protein [Gemmataceae bacterium]|nr:PhoPQ-activated protein PqaA family protein [Gemmataceae bacterium]